MRDGGGHSDDAIRKAVVKLRSKLPALTFEELAKFLATPMGRTLRFARVVDVLATRKRRTKLQLAFDRVHEEIAVITYSTEVRGKQAEVKGKSLLPMFLSIFQNLIEACHGDLIGRTCDIIQQIKVREPDLDVTNEALSDVLHALTLSRSGLVARTSPRIWRVHLAALSQPSSEFYKKFCETMSKPLRTTKGLPTDRARKSNTTSRSPRQR